MDPTNAIQIHNLAKSFGELQAVKGVNLDIPAGETFSLLGPNGAGKSTTIAMLCGLLAPDSGDALIMGHSITREPLAAKARLGVVPQDIAIYPDLSPRENLAFWGKMYGLRGAPLKQRIEAVLDLIGLQERSRDRAGTFSGGMKRRLNIGIALLHQPPVIIMDEPTVGIDPQSRRAILDSVKLLNEQGITVLYTTHYMEEAAELSAHIAIMDQGQVIACGTHDELIRIIGELDRINVTTAGAVDGLTSTWEQTEGVRKVTLTEEGISLLVEDSNRVLPRLFETAGARGVRIASVDIQEPNLEAVFLHLTGRALRN